MCSTFLDSDMDNYQGDLTDILRASAGALNQSDAPPPPWEFPSDPIINSLSPSSMDDPRDCFFGDPFCNMRDPLLHELNLAGSAYFTAASSSANCTTTSAVDKSNFTGASNIIGSGSTSNSCNLFSRVQILAAGNNNTNNSNSPSIGSASSSSPRSTFKAAAAAMVSSEMINVNNTSKGACLIDQNNHIGPVQISSPRNLGIKRRKSQAKKVVCIPAPAAVNSRPSGEVVPSDLWAWRKYGQKPIKGSPYPRGYYRCSSSKGCSARKQVERSRTDPNMLVITYTSEHNHPWPTQRNALAGSTRTQPPKTTAINAGGGSKSKEEQKESSSNDTTCGGSAAVKEELDGDQGVSYRPAMAVESDDFFAELGEIEPDPDLDLLFTQGFMEDDDEKDSKNKMDPFSMFSFEEEATKKRGL